jgi:hypothetical protein
LICSFPKIITDLRKKKGVSQKQAALDLGISQALLSHYEKGIRECGLDFLITLSNYYDVSTDTLLGKKSPQKKADAEQVRALKKIIAEAEDLLKTLE